MDDGINRRFKSLVKDMPKFQSTPQFDVDEDNVRRAKEALENAYIPRTGRWMMMPGGVAVKIPDSCSDCNENFSPSGMHFCGKVQS